VNDDPSLYEHEATLGVLFTGLTMRVKVTAYTAQGEVDSPALTFVLADVPGTPTPAPYLDTAESTIEQMELIFSNTNTDDGGSSVILVELQMDDGQQGDFVSILNTTYLSQLTITDVQRGNYYRFRYRVANVNGYSGWSSVAYLTPTSAPDAPPAPTFTSGTSTTVTLDLYESADNNGVPIDVYEVHVDAGDDLTSNFSKIVAYDGSASTITLTLGTDVTGSTGSLFRAKYIAKNEDGVYSEYSEELLFKMGGVPTAPGIPTKIIEESDSDQIAIEWTASSGDLPILGYLVYTDSGKDDDFMLVYDGTNSPDVLSYTLSKLESTLTYRVYVTAVNFNGESAASTIASLSPCAGPSEMPTPWTSEVTSTQISINWNEPEDNGGC